MAAEGGNGTEFKVHEETYAGFISMLKVSTLISIAATVVVVVLIAS